MGDTMPIAPAGSGYVFAIADDSEFYIPGALHVERDDDLFLYEDDAEAALAAERDGFPLIHGMENVPDGVYLDTEENRKIIQCRLEEDREILQSCQEGFPGYRTATHTEDQQPEMDAGPTLQ